MIRSLARLTAALLIIASAAVFATGVALERQSEPAAPTATTAPGTAADPGEGDADGGHEAGPAAKPAEHSELVFGVNLESTPLVVAAVVVSVLFAVAILTLGMAWLAGVIAVVMLAFAVLDVREIVHQLGESRMELAAVALVVALLHALAAVTAAQVARTGLVHRHGASA